MLRACGRLLKPGGRLAFYSIFLAHGLSPGDRKRARAGGPAHVASRKEHRELLRSAGFSHVQEVDVTPEFLETTRAWVEHRARYATHLRKLEGTPVFDQKQASYLKKAEGIEAGLYRRALFVAERSRR